MQAKNLNGGQELLCINTQKVYDWVLNEATFDLSLTDLELPDSPITGAPLECPDIDIDTVTCTVEPIGFDILDRVDQPFVIDGKQVMLQLVNIRKTFEVTIFVDLIPALGGATVEVGTAEFTRCEQVILCAPEDTDVNVTYTDLDCFVCTAVCDPTTTGIPDELDVTVSVRLCQSIQSTFDVTLEIVADFCQPRDVLPIPPCPAPTIPLQCPVVFPTDNKGHDFHDRYNGTDD
ncbi:hypothetical protein [Oceanobacillus saliphilus]|uniref:hypothetical protein n=1 Tax=Oceanobacillus saliphilus TaxID=2925834 RepID=UPI00201E5014|nr:hypothetical protein [Oceanobacillus saliphilus]